MNVYYSRRCLCLQLFIEAYDTGEPTLVSQTTVTIEINRNVLGPSLAPVHYTTFANDYDPIGTILLDIDATDGDITVSSHFP